MSGNIKQLDTRSPNKELIGLLEEVLEDAKSGEIIHGCFGFVKHNLRTGNFFTSGYPITLLGELTVLQRELTDGCVELRLHKPGEEY